MSIVKFKTEYDADSIHRVEVVRETKVSVFLARNTNRRSDKAERREAKFGTFDQYHDTWEAAHAYLMEKATEKVVEARYQLERANGKLGNIKGMPVGKVAE